MVQLGIIDNSDKDNKQGNQDRDRWASKVRRLSVYGPIETCSIMLFGDIERNSPATLLGQPVGSRVWVVNHLKDKELAPLGGVGELFIESPGLARYYVNDEDKSPATFVSDQPGWFKTRICCSLDVSARLSILFVWALMVL